MLFDFDRLKSEKAAFTFLVAEVEIGWYYLSEGFPE